MYVSKLENAFVTCRGSEVVALCISCNSRHRFCPALQRCLCRRLLYIGYRRRTVCLKVGFPLRSSAQGPEQRTRLLDRQPVGMFDWKELKMRRFFSLMLRGGMRVDHSWASGERKTSSVMCSFCDVKG